MKWSFVIQQKLKAALLLTGIMGLIILSTFISRSNIRGMDNSFSAIYEDRLVPTIDIVYISENLYHKRIALSKQFLSDTARTHPTIKAQLQDHNHRIDSLITAFEKTKLVQEESASLYALKSHVKSYTLLEQSVLRLLEAGDKKAGQELFEQQGTLIFQQAIKQLNKLTKIQFVIGQELLKDSHNEANQFQAISALQITIAIVIGLLVLGLIHSSKITDRGNQPFHLN
jgi:hypothetical protein